MTRSHRRVVATVFVLVVATVGAAGVPAPVSAAATGVSATAVTPSTVTVGDATTLSFSATVEGVDTSDGTSGASVTLSFPDTVDLSGATATNVVVGPNATSAAGTVDTDAGTVTVTWDDDTGVSDERLSLQVDVVDAVVTRTGESALSVDVDADAASGAELTAAVDPLTAVAPNSDRSVSETPATVYLGEQDVDVTRLDGVAPGGSSQQFYGANGNAEGTTARTADTLAVDVTAANGFVTGGYASSPAGDTVLSVVNPRVTDVALSPGATSSSVDVADGSIPRDTTQLTVSADYNFAAAENLTVTVEDEDGLDVTPQLTDAPTITTTGGSVTLDVSGLDAGSYNVTVEGADDLDNASRTVSVRLRDAEKVLSLSKTRVTRGESSIVSIAGAPGDVRYVRVDAEALREETVVNTPTARAVFDDTEAVQTIGADADAGVVYAVVTLDDDGLADVRLQTEPFAVGSVDVELTTGLDGPVEDDATLEVTERALTVDALPTTAVGESVTVSGTAAESDRVKLYAAVAGSYRPLYETDGLAEVDVDSDGTWEVDVDTSRVVDIPGVYRVVAVGDADTMGSTESVDSETLRGFDVRGSASLTTVEGGLSLDSSRDTIAATGTDEFTLSGTAAGQSDRLRLYHVGPRGETDLTLVDERDGAFETEVSGVDPRGTHTYLVVGAGRDGQYAHAPDEPTVDALLSGRETPTAAVEIIRDAYTGAGVDDRVAVVAVQAVDEGLTISMPGAQVAPTAVAVTGQSTNEDGSTVVVELSGANVTRFAEASVTNGTWNATLDLSDVPTGTYQLSAETATVRESRRLTVTTTGGASSTSGSTGTPSEEVAETTATDTPSDAPPTETTKTTEPVEQTGATGGQSTTDTQLPGFGGGSVLGALTLVVAALVALTRRATE